MKPTLAFLLVLLALTACRTSRQPVRSPHGKELRPDKPPGVARVVPITPKKTNVLVSFTIGPVAPAYGWTGGQWQTNAAGQPYWVTITTGRRTNAIAQSQLTNLIAGLVGSTNLRAWYPVINGAFQASNQFTVPMRKGEFWKAFFGPSKQ